MTIEAVDGDARCGSVQLARGSFATPCFMPVGTRGPVKLLDAADLESLRPEVVLANTYHLMLRPGAEVVDKLGGVGRFTGWPGLMLTDSGGFQVFSLGASVDAEGVSFKSVYDGSRLRLDPAGAVRIQEKLGADIQMALDHCCGLPAPDEVIRDAAERTLAWAAVARSAHRREDQSLFGIVQGGVSESLRAQCAERTVALDFDGYAIGGLSVGESRREMLAALSATTPGLPADQPRYLMGVGDPVSIVNAVAAGVDMFDCVAPTRIARHGVAMSDGGRVRLRSARFASDDGPLDRACSCPVCGRYSAGYIRHLLMVGEPTAGRLISLHNLHWMLKFMSKIRDSIKAGTLAGMIRDVDEAWSGCSLR
jgi:queuine tRNA-ribosyltransferase